MSPKKLVVCAGDSLTYGSGVGDNKATDSYPAQLNALLGEDYRVLNFGLRNATASLTGDLPYMKSKEYEKSLKKAKKADYVLLMLGTNDSKTYNWSPESYKKGLTSLVKSYQGLKSQPTVILMRSPYVYSTDGTEVAMYEIQPAVVRDELGSIVEEVANECGVQVIDLYSITENKDDLYTDGIHFNKEGYGLLAKKISSYF